MMARIIVVVVLFILQVAVARTSDLVVKALQSAGYPCEIHEVVTSDGYILTLHRIPPKNSTRTREPFILMHGLIGSGADFILPGKNRGLGCILHDQGYDVWLPNARGTTWSKKHTQLSVSSHEYWDFSWHEIGVFDIPAVIDKVLDLTGAAKVHYVAHSQGCTVFFVMLCDRPEYNDKIASVHLMSPVAFLHHMKSPPLLLLASKLEEIQALVNQLEQYELFASTSLNQLGGHILCGPGVPTQNLCIMLTYLTVGFSEIEIDRDLLPRIFETTPAGISAKQFLHFGQVVQAKRFQHFDYRNKRENYKNYRSKTPPPYNLKNIRIPLHLYSGSRDFLQTPQDVALLVSGLKNSRYTLKELRGFNHIDFLYSTEAPRRIYKEIVRHTKKNFS